MAFPLQSFNQHNGYVSGWKGEDEDLTDIDLTMELESKPALRQDSFTFVPQDSDIPPTDPKQKIARPANSFILFRTDFQAREKQRKLANTTGAPCGTVSRNAAAEWRKMGATAKKPWQDKAKATKALHAQLYPDYKFKPNKRKNEKKGPVTKSCPRKPRAPRPPSRSLSSVSSSVTLASLPTAHSPASTFSDVPSGPSLSRSASFSSSSNMSWDRDIEADRLHKSFSVDIPNFGYSRQALTPQFAVAEAWDCADASTKAFYQLEPDVYTWSQQNGSDPNTQSHHEHVLLPQKLYEELDAFNQSNMSNDKDITEWDGFYDAPDQSQSSPMAEYGSNACFLPGLDHVHLAIDQAPVINLTDPSGFGAVFGNGPWGHRVDDACSSRVETT